MTLTEFLLARIADDEWKAKTHVAFWEAERGDIQPFADQMFADTEGPWMRVGSGHVLAECEAKRRIIALHAATADGCDRCLDYADYTGDMAMETHPCQTLRYLAAVYADHPDYRDEWAPREA